MNTSPLRDRLRGIADVPVRFWVVALAAAGLLYLGGVNTDLARNGLGDEVHAFLFAVHRAALVLLAVAPVVALRWWWGGVALALPALVVAMVAGAAWPWVIVPAFVAVGVCSVWRAPRWAWVPAALAAVLAVTVIWAGGRFQLPYDVLVEFRYTRDVDYLLVSSLMYAAAVVLAMAGAHWMRFSARRSTDEAEIARRQRETISQAAALSERSRLAHDLHDVVAHHVSLIAVRAETAPYTQPGMGPEARGVLTEIAGDARLALDELRGVLGILHRAEDDTTDRSPQPGLADVPALVERSRAAGAEVTLQGAVDAGVLPGVGYVAYRVVQEALTNARRHAPGQPVEVSLESTSAGVVVTVANPIGDAESTGAPGRGLAGMRERVEALGGRLVVDSGAATFRVRAELPRAGR